MPSHVIHSYTTNALQATNVSCSGPLETVAPQTSPMMHCILRKYQPAIPYTSNLNLPTTHDESQRNETPPRR